MGDHLGTCNFAASRTLQLLFRRVFPQPLKLRCLPLLMHQPKLLKNYMCSKLYLCFMIGALWPHILYAQDKNALVEELYVKSGMQKQIEQVPLLLQVAFEQASKKNTIVRKLPEDVSSTITALAQKAFAPGILKEAVIRELRENLTIADIQKVLSWLDSPMGKRCTQLEEAASTPEGQAAMRQYAAALQNSPPSQERLEIFRDFDSAIKATESAVEMVVNTEIAVTLAMMTVLPLEQQRSLDDVSRDAEKHRPYIETAMRSHVLISFLYTYKDLTDAEIQQYVGFARSPAGSNYQSAGTAAMKKALIGSSIRLGKSIADAIQRLKTQTGT